jgi:DMSO/TMAO reductase YedYZ molybdopterin-dependent catalytic subunit
LDDEFTPADKFFIRNNGIPPMAIDPGVWTLKIEGESVVNRKSYTIADLKSKFKTHSYYLTLECGGNGRAGFYPPASGNQWTEGAVACSKWTGVRLKDILQDVGLKQDAVYIGYYGEDTHLSGEEGKVSISRGVPISKAMEDESLIAWALNDEDIPLMNGFPLRLVFGGWPASTSGKWLSKIVVRNIVHDGPKMEGSSYRVPKNPVQPGDKVNEEDFEIIESMPVKSLVSYPKTGAMIKDGEKLQIRGHAWAGELAVSEMHISIDFGATWQNCVLKPPVNRLAWQRWYTEVLFPKKGYYEVWAKATDSEGKSQPMVIPGWNPKGYLNNSCHRIAIKVV